MAYLTNPTGVARPRIPSGNCLSKDESLKANAPGDYPQWIHDLPAVYQPLFNKLGTGKSGRGTFTWESPDFQRLG